MAEVMQIAMVGLGRMGANMVRRLMRGGHSCVVHDRDPEKIRALAAEGATPAGSPEELVARTAAPRAIWLMVPAGAPVDEAIGSLAGRLSPGDVIIDGGNSYFKDDVRRAQALSARGIRFLDVGTSGGVLGLDRGYSLMIGGDREAAQRLSPVFEALAPGAAEKTNGRTASRGYLYCGPVGAGHFVKMVHNGIEYGLMQAYAEGFDILKQACSESLPPEIRYDLPMADVAEVWRRGSVISSFLLDLAAAALAGDPDLGQYTGFVEDSGEGRWTVIAAIEEAVPAEVISASLLARFRSRKTHTFAEKMLSALRHGFGGHVEHPTTR
jgi:6-phosphogluconate dehydrogenase